MYFLFLLFEFFIQFHNKLITIKIKWILAQFQINTIQI